MTTVGVTLLASALCGTLAAMWGWPGWKIGLAIVVPFGPLFLSRTVRTARHYGWLALFYVLTVTQLAHVGEHVVQMIQIHVLDLEGLSARGVFGPLNIEWVHFGWNTWVLIALLLLAWRFTGNLWLMAALALAAWHEAEHLSIMRAFLATGIPGSPGLLAEGGRLGGGVPILRQDLHFIYNVIETIPLAIAFAQQTRGVSDSWLVKAFPNADPKALVEASRHIRTRRFKRGDMIGPSPNGPMPAAYVVARGQVEIGSNLNALRSVRLRRGHVFDAHGMRGTEFDGTIRACSTVELVELDEEAVRALGTSALSRTNGYP